MECGAGNGTLLLSFLTSPASIGPQAFDLTGIDYSEGSTRLSAMIELQRRSTLEEDIEEWESDEEDGESGSEEDGEEGRDGREGGKRVQYEYTTGRQVINPTTCDWRTADLLRDEIGEQWDLVLDKGTFDALCLSQEVVEEKGARLPSVVYPEQVAKLVKDGGYFLITSCNFTEDEIRRRWTYKGLGLEYQ